MTEESRIFKGYLRGLLRQLKAQREALKNKDYVAAEKLLDNLIQDTEKDIAD